MLTLNDLVTDPPPDAVICSTCRGYGVVVAWTSCPDIMQTSEDCSQCAGKGWIKKRKRIPIQVRMSLTENLIHRWDVSDENGWRSIELWRVGDDLVLVAYDKDGTEVEPNV